MSEFLPAFQFMLPHEGGYSFTPGDEGGRTKFGISQAEYPLLDIEKLTLQDAQEIYQRDYWLPLYEQISSQMVANKLFDFGVNMGTKRATELLQRACRQCGEVITVDGQFGEHTLAAVNAISETNLLMAYRVAAGIFYRDLAASKPSNMQFLADWLKRANA